MGAPVYLDYNATTPVDPEVLGEMLPFLQTHFGNPSSAYAMGQANKEAINKARQQVAALINATPDEIYFTSCATESNNLAIQGVARANRDKGKHIITSSTEHPAVIQVCKYMESQGFEVSYLPVDAKGLVQPEVLKKAIRKDTVLVSIMLANNEVGTLQPINELAAIARQHKVLFHTDAAQALGKIETDVQQLGVDLLSIAGHKLYAPKGIGALYVKKGTPIKPILFGASQENGLRPGTENVPYMVALGKACEIAGRDYKKNVSAMLSAKERLLNGLKNNLGELIVVNGEAAPTLPNTLNLAFKGIDAHWLAAALSEDVLLATGSACHAHSIEPSAVLKAMNLDAATALSSVRISTGKYTSFDKIDQTIAVIVKNVRRFLVSEI
ncbi:MAG: cysteine desulfurase NifS [Bacteroidetes bacterium HGW-Bacteroidetes-4]|nr:MAG: cysteine desulfurase NifS [Bacteroidetes bacterium HGW-Bacteroidetes-4]